MVNEYKRIVLLKGLAPISDDHFSLFKSLMASDLGMNRKKQKQCTRDEIADMMEDKFKDDAGLGKLIKFCEDLSVLKKRAGILKKERSKVIGETSLEINRQEAGPAMPTSTTSHTLASERGETSTAHAETSTDHAETSTAQAETSTAQKRKSMSKEKTRVKKTKASEGLDQPSCSEEDTARWQSSIPQGSSSALSSISLAKEQKSQPTNQNMARDAILQTEPLTVMVLNATESFEYGSSEHGVKNMFHATVATVDQYFHVKVLNINMIEKFTKNNWITISNYFQSKGILEINEESIVSQAAPDRNNEVPKDLIRHANDSPKICDIQKGATGAVFYGEFKLYKKTMKRKKIFYEIKDYSGSMEVEMDRKCHDINCNEGDKLRLFCFYVKTMNKQKKLVCEDHSFIKVISAEEEAAAHSSTRSEE
ncbi:interferon-activable protein 204-like isoform X2 [Arvicanthis niloticus]|uniref:interferon-activable protein 204-like isoform X2 n=1 Tax=Arvicanthis niloticus TaxID=61156 RepID=UPI00148747CD|nr:interferon-activable protein 205-B-like [Arvicanthis niloticus]